jgi:hypothetical protein
MTFTAILPRFVAVNGKLRVEDSLDHSPSSISARNATFSFS